MTDDMIDPAKVGWDYTLSHTVALTETWINAQPVGSLKIDDLPGVIRTIYGALRDANGPAVEAAPAMPEVVKPTAKQIRDSITDDAGLASWLVTTTKRRCWRVGAQRRKDGERARSLDSDPEKTMDPVDEREDAADCRALGEKQLVRIGLDQLGGKCKDLLEALFGAGSEPNYNLIAEKLDIRVGSIGPTRARCLEKLSKILGRLGFGDDNQVGSESPDLEAGK